MKKILLSFICLLFLISNCLASPNNVMSLQYSPNPNETVNSSNYKTQENHQINTYNSHTHTDIATLGTVTTGTWTASNIAVAYGGTGQDFSSTAQGNIIYFSGTGTMAALGPGTSGQFLKTNGASANPAWADYTPQAATITQTMLKTTTGEVSVAGATAATATLPGGTYGFYPQIKSNTGGSVRGTFSGFGTLGSCTACTASASYITNVSLSTDNNAGDTVYMQQRYVTASGQDYWIFLLIDKNTKDIMNAYAAADHPAYGNGGDFNKVPHPFLSYNPVKHEIVILDKDTCKQLQRESNDTSKSILTLINEDYKVNIDKEETYQPLHSGRFINEQPELVQSIPSYIKCRKLFKMNGIDKQQKKQRQVDENNRINAEKISKENKIKQKLNLNDNELNELKEILK